ncbi:hypothetical protein UlMin_027316 [Ulmus minor]
MEYGSSLIVPSVQELAKEGVLNIPSRYIRSDEQDQKIVNFVGVGGNSGIPVIDMETLDSPHQYQSSDFELAKLHSASKDWGFFQVVNHGISSSLLEKTKAEIEGFFKLPMEEKKKLWQRPGDVEGFGQAFVVSEEQKLDWSDMFFLTTLPAYMRKPHLFPNLPISFRESLEIYALEVQKLAMKILTQMEKALKIEDKEITGLFEDGMQTMRFNYYPPCPHPEKVIGITPHSDGGALTILLQVNEVEGLQIRKDGMWVPVKPLPNAFIVNVGDELEMTTNGIYRSIEHRASVNSDKERLSVATFYNPRTGSEIGPVKSLISPQTPAKYITLGLEDYLKRLFARELHGKAFIDTMKI